MNIGGGTGQQQVERVLILTVSAGEGHTRAAAAVKKQIKKHHPAAQVSILDTFRYASPRLESLVLGTYIKLLKLSPVLYKYLYNGSERGNPLGGIAKNEFTKIMTCIVAPKLLDYINWYNPQIILCTHPFTLGITSVMKQKGQLKVPVIAQITDFTVHSYWVYSNVDYYCVANEQLIPQLVEYRYPPEKIIVTGIPIDTTFADVGDKLQLREKLNLAPELLTILVMGGGLGLGPLKEVVDILAVNDHFQVIVVCGHNQKLKQEIGQATYLHNHIHTYGFVDNIHELMGATDIMVTKAGGLSCSEALAAGLPLLIIDPIPGQEERNTEFLVNQGAAVRIKDAQHLQRVLKTWLKKPQIIDAMARASSNTGKPNSAEAVRVLVQQIITSGR